MGDEAPTKRLQGPLARLVVLSDYEKLLARSAVVSTGKVVEPVISHIESVDDRKVHRTSGLYDAPAHAAEVVIDRLVVKRWELSSQLFRSIRVCQRECESRRRNADSMTAMPLVALQSWATWG